MDNRDLAAFDKRQRATERATRYVDITPTWKGLLPLLMFALETGTHEGKAEARAQLQRMAEAADKWNASKEAAQ